MKLKADKEMSEAMATGDERIAMNAQKLQKMAELRREEGRSFSDALLDQTKKRLDESKRKAELMSRSRVREYQEKEEEEGLGELNPLISRLHRDLKQSQGAQGRSIGSFRTNHDWDGKHKRCDGENKAGEKVEEAGEEEEMQHRVIKKRNKPGFM